MFEDALIAWHDDDDPRGNVQHIAEKEYPRRTLNSPLPTRDPDAAEAGQVAARLLGARDRMAAKL
jgi:hypothetical protein